MPVPKPIVTTPVDPPPSTIQYMDDFTGTGDIDLQLLEPMQEVFPLSNPPPPPPPPPPHKPDLKGVQFDLPVRSCSPNNKFNHNFSLSCSSSSVCDSSASFSSESSGYDSESDSEMEETNSSQYDKDSRQVKLRKRKLSQDSCLTETKP